MDAVDFVWQLIRIAGVVGLALLAGYLLLSLPRDKKKLGDDEQHIDTTV